MSKIKNLFNIFHNIPSSYKYIHSPCCKYCNSVSLLIFRISGMLICLTTIIFGFLTMDALGYIGHFTEWGLTISFIAYIFLPLGHLLELKGSRQKENHNLMSRETPSKFNLWTQILVETSFATEFVISVAFFCLLLPVYYSYSTEKQDSFGIPMGMLDKIYNGAAHTFPILFLTAEILLNQMTFVQGHYWLSFLLCFFFILMDIILTFAAGRTAYGFVLTYRNYYTVFILLGLLLTLTIGFLIGYYLTHKKTARISKGNHSPHEVEFEVLY